MLNIKQTILGSLVAGSFLFGCVTPAVANTFTDSNEISDWSLESINTLVEYGFLVGYPDGSFAPKEDITREELAVVMNKLTEGLIGYLQKTESNRNKAEYRVSSEVYRLRSLLSDVTARVKDLEVVEIEDDKNNFVGLGLAYTINQAEGTGSDIELYGKYQLVEFSDTLALSARGTVDTNTLLTGGLTLDVDLGTKLELFGGVGAAYVLDTNNTSSLVGNNVNTVVPIALVGGQYSLTDATAVYTKASIPLTVENEEEAQISGGLVFKF